MQTIRQLADACLLQKIAVGRLTAQKLLYDIAILFAGAPKKV